MLLKRPLCIATILYILGILIGLYLHVSIAFLLIICLLIGSFLYMMIKKKIYIVFILFFILGVVQVKLIDADYENTYQNIQEQEIYKIKAIIVSDRIHKEYKDVYQIKIVELNGKSQYQNTNWLLNVKKAKNANGNEYVLEYGDFIELEGSIEIPSTARNYGGFNYQQYLKTKKIYGTIDTKEPIKVLEKNKVHIYEKILHDIADDMKNKIYQLLPNDAREICIGILIGERTDLSEEINLAFKNSNLTHMLAVSGAHISYIILGLSILLSKNGKRFQKIFIIIFLIFFMGLTKFTPSVERASIMAILVILASLLHRKADVYHNLALSAIIILVINPYTILNIGFQLSYGGTIGIILFHQKISKRLNKKLNWLENYNTSIERIHDMENPIINIFKKILKYILNMLMVTISANLVIIPIMIFQFNTLSLTFWISNILAGPFIGLITILGFILYFVSLFSMSLAHFIAVPLKILLKLLIFISQFCSQLPFSKIISKTPYIIEIIFYYVSIYYFFDFQKIKEKILTKFKIFLKNIKFIKEKNNRKNFIKLWIMGITFAIIVSIIIIVIYHNQSLKIYLVDVGQGDCTLICTPTGKTILVDGGGSENSSFDVGERILFPYLLDRRITTIDYMIISHFDSDHVRTVCFILWKT